MADQKQLSARTGLWRNFRDNGDTTYAEEYSSQLRAWDPTSLAWVKVIVDHTSGALSVTGGGGGGGGGGAVTIADGADVAQGTTTDLSSANTVIGLLKAIKAAITGTLSVSGSLGRSWTLSSGTDSVSASVSNTVTVDTEIPAATSLTDGTANPNTPLIGVANELFNGTTWDRAPGDKTNGAKVQLAASSITVPVNVANSPTVDTELPAAASLTDGAANPTAPVVGADMAVFNGTTWDRLPGDKTNGAKVNIAASSVTVPVNVANSPTVTANQGTAAAVGSAWPTKVTDGTNAAAVKAASTAAAAADPSLVVAQSPNSPTPAGTNRIGSVRPVDSADADLTAAKGSQTSRAMGTQDLKDSGRTPVMLIVNRATSVTAEAMATMTVVKPATSATSATADYTVTAGKTFRIQTVLVTILANSATAINGRVSVRSNTAGATTTSSPQTVLADVGTPPGTAAAGTGADPVPIPIPDGLELPGGTHIGISHLESNVNGTVTVQVIGYEY